MHPVFSAQWFSASATPTPCHKRSVDSEQLHGVQSFVLTVFRVLGWFLLQGLGCLTEFCCPWVFSNFSWAVLLHNKSFYHMLVCVSNHTTHMVGVNCSKMELSTEIMTLFTGPEYEHSSFSWVSSNTYSLSSNKHITIHTRSAFTMAAIHVWPKHKHISSKRNLLI